MVSYHFTPPSFIIVNSIIVQFSSCDVLLLLCGGQPLYGQAGRRQVGGALDRMARVLGRALRHRVIHRRDPRRKRRSAEEGSRRRASLVDSDSDEESSVPFLSAAVEEAGMRMEAPPEGEGGVREFLKER